MGPWGPFAAHQHHSTSSLRFSASIRAVGDPPQPVVQRMGYALDPAGDEPIHSTCSPYHRFGFPDEAVAYFQNTSFIADLSLEMTRLLQSVHDVGPLREYPHRLYQ